MSSLFRREGWLFLLFLLIVSLLYLNLTTHASTYVGEPFEDMLRHRFGIERLRHWALPLWNPYIYAGQPHFLFLLLTSFPSPLDLTLAQASRLLDLGGSAMADEVMDYVTIVYASLFCLGFFKLARFWTEEILGATKTGEVTAFLWAIFALIMFYDFGAFGHDYIFCQILIFPCYTIYYFSRLLRRQAGKARMVKMSLAILLSFYSPGSYAVPASIILINLLLGHLLIRNPKNWGVEVSQMSLWIWAHNRQTFFALVILAVGLFPHLAVYKNELPQINRHGRVLENLDYQSFVNGQKGQHYTKYLEYFSVHKTAESRLPVTDPLGINLLFGFCFFLSLILAFKRGKLIPLAFTLAMLLTVHMGYGSPFLYFYYNFLFPFLQKLLYLDIYYDLCVLLILALSASGAAALGLWQVRLEEAALALMFTIVLLWIIGKEIGVGSVEIAILCLILGGIWLLTQSRRLPRQAAFLFFLLVFSLLQVGTHYNKLIQFRLIGFQVASKEAIHHRPFVEKYLFYPYRIDQPPYPWEAWMIGTPLIEQKPAMRPFALANSKSFLEFNSQIGSIDRRNRYLGITAPIIRFSRRWTQGVITTEGPEIDFLEDPAPIPNPGGLFDAPHQLEVSNYDPEHLDLILSVQDPGLLVISQNFHSGWKAQLNGESVPLMRVNHTFMGIFLNKPGKHDLRLLFSPPERILIWAAYAIFWAGAFFCLWSDQRVKIMGMTPR
ncbi:MAG: hypothetical protein A2527_05605 [Candidatus Lambdaproteobacteria bacterium RIFOXYD2_FULL_50_16]|uniref:Membrane protein 6-pyruvoyl-tetrahydropterin synthase-related domain-containing protein n=1 Tax=Candidatus Lambdaproteobacteria bacterium RIFOXYD2_FULL_50_16 TaxID=1817772 RepID=A0A1F6G9D8_9PROT|nr:MAG: hypothetical protein A2527_05605 [Candidatus Lambdaproteobacteria bacterium RIFOXYD2_FULL_50_16]